MTWWEAFRSQTHLESVIEVWEWKNVIEARVLKPSLFSIPSL